MFGRGKRGDRGVAAGALGGVRVRGLARARRARGPRRGVLRPFRRAVHRGDDGRVPPEPGPPRARRRLLGRAGAPGPGERAKIPAVARDAGLRARQPRREVRVRGVPARKGPGALRRDARVPRTHRRPRTGPPREPAHVAALRTERVAHRHPLPPHRRGLDRVGPRRRAIPRRGRTTTRGIGIFGDLLRIFPPGPAAARDGGGRGRVPGVRAAFRVSARVEAVTVRGAILQPPRRRERLRPGDAKPRRVFVRRAETRGASVGAPRRVGRGRRRRRLRLRDRVAPRRHRDARPDHGLGRGEGLDDASRVRGGARGARARPRLPGLARGPAPRAQERVRARAVPSLLAPAEPRPDARRRALGGDRGRGRGGGREGAASARNDRIRTDELGADSSVGVGGSRVPRGRARVVDARGDVRRLRRRRRRVDERAEPRVPRPGGVPDGVRGGEAEGGARRKRRRGAKTRRGLENRRRVVLRRAGVPVPRRARRAAHVHGREPAAAPPAAAAAGGAAAPSAAPPPRARRRAARAAARAAAEPARPPTPRPPASRRRRRAPRRRTWRQARRRRR